MPSEPLSTPSGILDAWSGIIRRRWKVGLALFVVILGLASWFVLGSRPIYRAEASLRLGEPPPMGGVSPNAGIFGLFQLGGDPFANDLELLFSRTLIERVVSDASLNATLVAPRGWHRDSLFQDFSAGRATDEATFELTWEDGSVRVRRTSPVDSLVGTVPTGTSLRVGDLTLRPLPRRRGMPRQVEVRTVPHGEAVRILSDELVVEKARREANVVQISFKNRDPVLARTVVGSVISRFIELRTALQQRESGQTVDSLRSVANRTLAELTRAERDMENLQRRLQLIAPEAQNEAFIERYSEAVGQLESARAEFAAISALLRRVDSISDPEEGWADLAAYPAFLENETVGELLSGLNRLNEQRMELASRRTPRSREHQVLIEQIARRDSSIRAIADGYRTALQDRIRLAEARVAGMQRFLAGVPQQAIDLGRRQREVRVLSEVLVLTEQRLRQEELRQALTFANVQVIDPPAVEHRPVWPRKKLGLGVGLLLASVFGILGMIVTERADRTVRRARDVRELTGKPVLGISDQGSDREVRFTPREVNAILGNGRLQGRNPRAVAIVPIGADSPAEAVANALRAGVEAGGDGDLCPDRIRVMAADTIPAAAAIDAPVVLTVVCGRTPQHELRHSVNLLRQVGGEIVGTVVVCPGPTDAGALWE